MLVLRILAACLVALIALYTGILPATVYWTMLSDAIAQKWSGGSLAVDANVMIGVGHGLYGWQAHAFLAVLIVLTGALLWVSWMIAGLGRRG